MNNAVENHVPIRREYKKYGDDEELDSRFRNYFQGAFPAWKAREIVVVNLPHRAACDYAEKLSRMLVGDGVEGESVSSSINRLKALRETAEGYGLGIGLAISIAGCYGIDTGCTPRFATIWSAVDWKKRDGTLAIC